MWYSMTDLQDNLSLIKLAGADDPGATLLGFLFFVFGAVLGLRESPRKACSY